MIDNSKEALLARLEQGDVMNGWGAIMALGREPLEQMLKLRYLEGLSQSNFLEPITGRYFTDGQRNDEVVFEGLVLGPPQLSFRGVSGSSARLTVRMPFIAGEYASYSRLVAQPPRLKSSHGLREEMGYHVQMSVELVAVNDPAANQARLVLDLSHAEGFIGNLGESEIAHLAMGRFIQAEMVKNEVFSHQFVLLACELAGHDALALRGLSVRTQAAPEGIGREGDGAAIVQLDLRGRRFGGTWPEPGAFPYLLPDGSEGVTLLVEQLRMPLLGEFAENLLQHLSLPKAWQLQMKEEHSPHDRVVFGGIQTSPATRQVEPMQARLGREQVQPFKVEGHAVSAWAARNISHPRSSGAISPQGEYQASDTAHFARENQVILVSAQLANEAPEAVNAALVIESADAFAISPRVAVWRPGERPIDFKVSHQGAVSWTPVGNELEDLGNGQARFTPDEPGLVPEVLLKHIRATDDVTGDFAEATVVILAYPAVLNVLPFHLPRMPFEPVQFEVENDRADSWLLWGGEGEIDPHSGLYTPPASPTTPVAVVMADIDNRYVGYAVIELMREAAQVSMISERYKKVKAFTLTPVPVNGTLAYANGLQQIALDIVIETEDFRNSEGDLIWDPVSDLELSTLKLLAQNGNPIEYVLEGAEGLDPEAGARWGWSKSPNRYDYYAGPRRLAPRALADDEGKRFLRVYVQSTEAEVRKFHAEFKGYDNRSHNSRAISKEAGEVELIGRRTPVWAQNNYEFKSRRVAAQGGKVVGQDTFNYYKYTTDYWELFGVTQEYGNLEFHQVSFDHASIIRWESEQLEENFCTYVGYAFKPLPAQGMPALPVGVSYEAALQLLTLEPKVGYHDKLDYALKAGEDIAPGTLLLTLDRVWDMPYWYDGMSAGGDYRASLEGTMRFTLIDQQGNRHRLNVNFLPAAQPDSRNKLELRIGGKQTAAVDSAVHSNAFNFMSYIQNGVDPRTGQYSLGIELPELIGNYLCGPRLPLRLNFNPMNDQDSGFGIGWALNLSQYEIGTGMLSLSTGERFKVSDNGPGVEPQIKERKLDSFHFHNESEPDQQQVRYRVVHKSGLVEVLEPQDNDKDLCLPVRVLAPSGHGLTLEYERDSDGPRLVRVSDDSGRELLAIDYSSNHEVLLDLHPSDDPGIGPQARYTLSRNGDDELTDVVLPTDDQASWHFDYQRFGALRCVSRVDNPLGGTERIYYRTQGHRLPPDKDGQERWLPNVERHVVEPGAGQPDMVTEYSFSPENFLGFGGTGIVWGDDGLDNLYKLVGDRYEYTSTARYLVPGEPDDDGNPTQVPARTITRAFNRFHLLKEQVTSHDNCVETVSTTYHEQGGDFAAQPAKFQLPHVVNKAWSLADDPREYRDEQVTTDYDEYGNLTEETQANGIRTVNSYYPADADGFVRHPEQRWVYPASDGEAGADVLRTDFVYYVLPSLDDQARGEWLPERETLVREADETPLRSTFIEYYRDTADRLRYGRSQREQRTVGESNTTVSYDYEPDTFDYRDEDLDVVGHPAVRTTETVEGFDHGRDYDDEQGVRNTRKVITLLHSVLIGEPLLNRDDNDVEIAYLYDALRRVLREIVAPNDPVYKARRKYTYALAAAAGQQAVQTREDVKEVITWSYVDGLGREVREERQDVDFGLTPLARKASRISFTVMFDALGNKVEEVEYDWFERTDRKLTTTFEYDGWGQQCCTIGPDGVRVHERTDQQGSAQWRTGPVVTQYRESADGKRVTGKTVTGLNRFGEPARIERFYADGTSYSVQQSLHDGLGRLAREVDARCEQVRFARDAFDRLVDHTLQNGAVVHRDYAAHSSEDLPTLIKVIHADGKPGSVLGHQEFDGLDRMIVSITGGRRRVMQYDPGQHQPRFVTTPKKHKIEYRYAPALGEEPLQRHLVDANVNAEYAYDPHNARLMSCFEQPEVDGRVADPSEVQELARDYFSTGDLKSETRTVGQETFDMVYVHSLRGRLLAYTDVLGQLQHYAYDAAGRLESTSLGTTSSVFAYDDLGRTARFTTVDGETGQSLTTELFYDDFEREELRRFIFAQAVQELRQEYSVVDAIVFKELTGISDVPEEDGLLREEHFEYDARARLEYYSSEGPLSPVDPHDVVIESQEFYLDDIDNIEEVRTWHADGRIDVLYAFDNLDDPAQLTSLEVSHLRGDKYINSDGRWAFTQAGPQVVSHHVIALEYDDDGNLVRDEAGRVLGYDPLGRMVSVTLPERGETGTYGYDPLDRLAVQSLG